METTVDEQECLRREIERLNAEIMEANEERAQAAQYGLAILEEKQALQEQFEDLQELYHSTNKELSNTISQMQLVQSDYEKRVKDVEHREEKLLSEMEARENVLLVKNKNLVDDVRILQQQLKNSESRHQEDADNNIKLSKNIEKYKLIEKNLREDVKELRKTATELNDDKERLTSHVKQLTEQAELFSGVQNNYTSLYEANTGLKAEREELQGRLEATIIEKEELEKLNQDITDALNEERESKEILEIKLREGSYQLPQVSWEEEEGEVWNKENKLSSSNNEEVVATSVNFSSTPIPNKTNVSSLFNELQTTDHTAELDELREAMDQAKQKITTLLAEKSTLEEKVSLTAAEEAREEAFSNDNTDGIIEKDKILQELREEIDTKNTLLERLHQQVKVDGTEKTALEIKIEALANELQNVKENFRNMVEMKDKEINKLDGALQEVHEHKAILEGDLNTVRTELDHLESVLGNSHNELITLVGQLKNLKKAVETLYHDVDQPNTSQGQPDLVPKSDLESSVSKVYSLKIKSHKIIEVDEEKQCFTVVAVFKELLQSLRVPIDKYTRIMLSRSLHNSNKDSEVVSSSIILVEKNAEIAKLKNRIMHKSEELNNLRSIMKARQTTADVGYKTLQSQLESERAKFNREISQLKYEVKELQKENAELENFKTIYLQRFEDLLSQTSKLKHDLEKAIIREDETNRLLEKTIQRKLELTQDLEEYEIKNEALYIIPQRMESSRI